MEKKFIRPGSPVAGLFVLMILLAACNGKTDAPKDPAADFPPDAHYYSIIDFIRDQYSLMAGQPRGIVVVTSRGNSHDTEYMDVSRVKWSPVYQAAAEADISPRRYLGRYRFTNLVDSSTLQRNLIYEAAEPDLPTRRLLVTVNPENDRITSVFVQFEKNGMARRMFYEPQKYLRIDEEGGKAARSLRTEYFWQ